MANEMVKYTLDSGELMTLTPNMVRNYIAPDARVTDAEVHMFLELCKHQKLNPFTREVYLVKYGTNPANMVTGKEAFTKRAQAHPDFNGMEAGIIVLGKDGKLNYRAGTIMARDEELVGGWAKVHLKTKDVPIYNDVQFDEYAGRDSKGNLSFMWRTKPATMIRKVALVQALREAFPDRFAGLYSQEEISHIETEKLPIDPIPVEQVDDEPEYLSKREIAELLSVMPKDKVDDAKAWFQRNGLYDFAKIPVSMKATVAEAMATIATQQDEPEEGQVFEDGIQDIPMHEEPEPELEDIPEPEPEPEPEPDWGNVRNVVEAQQKSGNAPNADMEFPFGKHKGSSLAHIWETDAGYLDWFLSRPVKDDQYKQKNQEQKDRVQEFVDYMNGNGAPDDDYSDLPFNM